MLVLHMSNKVIIPLDSLLTNILTFGKWTVNPLNQVHHLIVSVKCLFRFERGGPGTIGCATSVGTTGAGVWATSLC